MCSWNVYCEWLLWPLYAVYNVYTIAYIKNITQIAVDLVEWGDPIGALTIGKRGGMV